MSHVATVVSLNDDAGQLSGGNDTTADALVLCTGWKVAPGIAFLPEPMVGQPCSDEINDGQETRNIYRDLLS